MALSGRWRIIALTLALSGPASSVFAQEHDEAAHEQAEPGASHEFHRNHAALFLGGATRLDPAVSGFTIGADYERRLSRLWGIGVLVDVALGEVKRETVVGVPVFLHAWRGLVLWVAPGLERLGAREESEATEEEESETDFLVRFGLGYELELKERFSISPQFNADISGGHWTLVYGLAFGVGF